MDVASIFISTALLLKVNRTVREWKIARSNIFLIQAFSWLGFNTNWYLLFPECFFILSVVFVFQNCLCWFLHYESHPVGKRILRCHPFWYLGCYPSHVVWNFSPTNLYWCIFWLQGEGRALWIHFWNTLVFCSWAIEFLIQELVWLNTALWLKWCFSFSWFETVYVLIKKAAPNFFSDYWNQNLIVLL